MILHQNHKFEGLDYNMHMRRCIHPLLMFSAKIFILLPCHLRGEGSTSMFYLCGASML